MGIRHVKNLPRGEGPSPVTADDARAALEFWRGAPFYAPSPLVELPGMASELGLGSLYLKDEGRRFGPGAFKLLGAGYAMARALCGEGPLSWDAAARSGRRLSFYTATDGNHGRAVAFLAREFGCRAVVLMPEGSSRERFEAIAAEGASVSIEPMNYDACVRRARALAGENGGVLLQDTVLPGCEALPHEIMRGYGALFAECADALPEPPTHVFLQAGVGSFAGAGAGALTELLGVKPVYFVAETAAAPCLMLSAGAGERRCVGGEIRTIMAGLACGEPCEIGLAALLDRAEYFAALPDESAAEAVRALYREGIVAGESGAAGCALLRELMLRPELEPLRREAGLGRDSRVLVFNTETATDLASWRAIVGNFPGQGASFGI